MEQKPALNLLDYRILSFSYKTNEKFKDITVKKNTSKLDFALEVFESNEDPLLFKLDVRIGCKMAIKAPYRFDLHIEGFFSIDEQIPTEHHIDIVKLNGATILYGLIREYVFLATAHGRYGPLQLTTLAAQSFISSPKK